MFKNVIMLIVVMLMGSAFTQSAGAADTDYVREARDRAAIEQLMWNYVRALDTFNSEAYVATYTEDGQFIAGGKPIKGHAALKKMIDDYQFGSMKIAGKKYRNDLKIINGQVIADWWRKEGHSVEEADVEDIIQAKPDIVVVGMGKPGRMQVGHGRQLSSHGLRPFLALDRT